MTSHRPGRDPRFAIVGVGPRGLTIFERLCANLRRTAPGTVVEVVLIDSARIGTGTVWRIDQPRLLLMNTVASQITVFTDESVEMNGPVQIGPSLYEWARYLDAFGAGDGAPADVLAEAAALTPDTYPSRSFFGHYLLWCYQHIRRVSHSFVKVTEIIDTAVALSDHHGTQRIDLAGGQYVDDLDAVVLTQGHLPVREGSAPSKHRRSTQSTGMHRIGPGNAADVDLDRVEPATRVIVRGLGLTFFDYLALLTEGRAGRFHDVGGRLEYCPSGAEPLMYAGSRRGVPHHARGENQKGVSMRHEPLLLTPDRIVEFRRRATASGDVEFRRDIWPLIAREVEITYYTTLRTDQVAPDDLRQFGLDYATATPAGQHRLLVDIGVTEEQRWNWPRIMSPAHGLAFADPNAFHRWLLSYLSTDVDRARQGNLRGPVKAALDVLRDLRNEVRLLVDHAGITGSSYRDDLDGWYTPMNAFLSIGPPARRIAEMAAIIRSGVLTVIGPAMTLEADSDRFIADSPHVAGSRVSACHLIDARLPEPDIRRTGDRLIATLLRRGESRCYTIEDPRERPYRTGGLDVTAEHRLVDTEGRPHRQRFALGVPTEKVRWVTAAGPRPGVNSVTFADADDIARTMLDLATVTLAPRTCLGCPL